MKYKTGILLVILFLVGCGWQSKKIIVDATLSFYDPVTKAKLFGGFLSSPSGELSTGNVIGSANFKIGVNEFSFDWDATRAEMAHFINSKSSKLKVELNCGYNKCLIWEVYLNQRRIYYANTSPIEFLEFNYEE